MNRIHTYTSLDEVTSAQLNAIQDAAAATANIAGLMLGGTDLDSYSGTTILISRIQALTLGAGSVVGSTSGVSTFTPSTDVGTGAAIVANTWYFVYAYLSGSSVAFECDSTAPDTDKIFKSGDASRRYVGSFHTSASSTNIHPFVACRGAYRYRLTAWTSSEGATGAGSPLVLLSSTTTSAQADRSLDALVPPTAKLARVFMQIQGSGGGASTPTLTVRPSGSVDTAYGGYPLGATLSCVVTANANDLRQQTEDVAIGSYGSLPTHRGLSCGLATSNGAAGLAMVTGYAE